MATLTGALILSRAVLSEVVKDPNVTPRIVVAGTAAGVGGGTGKPDQITLDGAFRSYGNSSVRLILGSSTTQTQTFALRALGKDQIEVVKALEGHTVCYRDTYGRRIFGAYIDISVVNIPFSGGLADVGLVIQTVSSDEAV